jgi:molybdopterin molybdotransferase
VTRQHRVGLSSVDAALAWVDTAVHRLEPEDAPLCEAIGRVLTEDIRAERPIPACNSAAVDGFAVSAQQTFGASSYNPLSLPLISVAAGDALPAGTDTVVPFEHGDPDDAGNVVVVDACAVGGNVDRRGAVVDAGAVLISAGTAVGRRHIGILAAAGFARVPVVRRPRVEIAAARVPRAGPDSNTPMLCTLIERDGGTALDHSAGDRSRSALRDTLLASRSDIVLVVGGTGPGRDDVSAAALAAAGGLAIHGIALSPGETAGFGRTAAGVPVVLLPGSPAACFCCFDLFAGRAIRHLGGRDPRLPYRSSAMSTARKIVSAIGMTEIVPVRCLPENLVEPIASFSETGLMAAVSADGFVVVPETSEGYPPGAAIDVYLYDDRFAPRKTW